MKYFAYGTLTDRALMLDMCPDAEVVCDAVLHGYEMHGLNITELTDAETTGILWEITDEGLARLDRYEGYPASYHRKRVSVETTQGDVRALVYFIPACV